MQSITFTFLFIILFLDSKRMLSIPLILTFSLSTFEYILYPIWVRPFFYLFFNRLNLLMPQGFRSYFTVFFDACLYYCFLIFQNYIKTAIPLYPTYAQANRLYGIGQVNIYNM